MHLVRSCVTIVALALALHGAQAQELGNPRRGEALARQICAECHAVGHRRLRSPNPQSPSFVAIASTPGMNGLALNAFLHTSHANMPNIILTGDQAQAIIAYILTLKK